MGRLVDTPPRSGAPRADAASPSVHDVLKRLPYTARYYHRHWIQHHPAIVFALSLHWSSDSVGWSIWEQKSLPGFDDLDETRRIWPRPASFFHFLGGQRMFNRFPSKLLIYFSFSCLYAQHAWRAKLCGVSGDGNYPRDLTNFFGHSFLAFRKWHWVRVRAGTGKRDGMDDFSILDGRSFLECFFLCTSPTSLPLLDLSSIYTMIFFFYIFIFRSRSKYLRSFLRRMRRWMGRMEEEKTKQNNFN
jgi:hypothetical protein